MNHNGCLRNGDANSPMPINFDKLQSFEGMNVETLRVRMYAQDKGSQIASKADRNGRDRLVENGARMWRAGNPRLLELDDEMSLTQAEQEMLVELKLEQELRSSISSRSHVDDRGHRSSSLVSGVVDSSGMLVPQSYASLNRAEQSVLAQTSFHDAENDDEAALLAAGTMILDAQQSRPSESRRIHRVSSTRSQSSISSQISHASHVCTRASDSRGSFVSYASASQSSFVSHGTASTIDGRPRPVYDWERELIAKREDDMDASIDGIEGFYEDSNVYIETQPRNPQESQLNNLGRPETGYGRQSGVPSDELQHWARRPPGRTRSSDFNDGIEQYWVDDDQELLSQHVAVIPQGHTIVSGQRWNQRQQRDTGRAVTDTEIEHLSYLEQEMMELAVQSSMDGGGVYENV
ncbi:hypothetical protein MPSEU_000779100 [Mayamaea pseudoterrestris]|nr:hypothetical protein MPSEU_000779100 [Mayamaea pseudoterrestris]